MSGRVSLHVVYQFILCHNSPERVHEVLARDFSTRDLLQLLVAYHLYEYYSFYWKPPLHSCSGQFVANQKLVSEQLLCVLRLI